MEQAVVGPAFSRRQILGMAGALATVRVRPKLVDIAPHVHSSAPRASAPAADELSLAHFAPYVGSEFELRTGGADSVRVTLAEATARAPRPADRVGLSGESFSLVFAGDATKAFDHGTPTVVHPGLGEFPLFVVAIDRAWQAQHYQAVVDRRTPGR